MERKESSGTPFRLASFWLRTWELPEWCPGTFCHKSTPDHDWMWQFEWFALLCIRRSQVWTWPRNKDSIWFSFLDVRLNLWHPFLWRCDNCKQFLISVQLCVTKTWFLRLMDWIQHKTWNIFLSLSFHGTCLMETKKITFESCHLHKTFSEDVNSSVQRNAGRALRNDMAQIWKLTAYTTPGSIWVKYLTSHQSPDVKHNPSCHSNFFR
jgi:hypothetical protein